MIPTVEFVPGKRSCLRVRFSLFALILAGLLLPVAAWAQVTYTGTAANQNFGSQAIGSPSATTALSFSVSAGTTVGSIAVVTMGAPNLDFTNATGSTCAATTYASAANCTVNVTFTPKFAGLRKGAVVFFSAAGNTGTILGSVLIYGVGTGPQIAYGPGTAIAIAPTVNVGGYSSPTGVAVDGAGDLFISYWDKNLVVEVPAGGGAPIVIDPTANGIPIYNNHGVTVDGAGDLFIADLGNNRVVEVPAGGGAATAIDPTVNGEGLNLPSGVAIDGVGDLFIADHSNSRVLEVPAGGGAPTVIDPTVNGKTLSIPYRVAFDVAGDLFIADLGNNRVVEVPAGGSAAIAIDPTVNGEGLNQPTGVAVDGAGDLFIADTLNYRVVEVPAGGGAPTVIDPTVNGASLSKPWDITFDGAGDLFIADFNNSRVVEIQRSQPPALNFPTVTDVGSTDTTDGTKTVQVQNIGNQALTLTALSYPADFSEAGGDANACTGSTSLTAGQHCDFPVEFTPEHSGALSEGVTLTDNALNVTGAQQSVGVSGTGLSVLPATHFSVTTTASVAAGVPFSITVTALDSASGTATSYNGTVSFTSSDPDFVNPGPLALSSGVGQATVTLKTTGTQTITATDTTTSSLTGSGSFPVTATPPGYVFFNGTAANQNFGAQAIGTPSATAALSFSVSAGTTVGSIGVVTQGAPNLDFTNAAGTTCAAQDYTSVTTCTVDVTFTPKFAGIRKGAVVFFSAPGNTGTILGSLPIYGVGSGPQIAYGPATAIAIAPTANGAVISSPTGVAVDGAGDVFISIWNQSRVVEVPAGGGAATVIDATANGISLYNNHGVAVDGAGDLFIADLGNNRVVEVPAGGGAATAIDPTVDGEGLNEPIAVAIDGVGDLFIADNGNSRVLEMPAGGGAPTVIDPTVNGKTLSIPYRVAFDVAGDLFIADEGNNRVVEVPAGGGAATAIDPTVNGEGLGVPDGVAVDGAGDLFIADRDNNRLVEVPTGGGAPTAIDPTVNGASLSYPWDITFDGAGDLFIADWANGRIVEIQRSQPPALNFPTATLAGSTDTTDGTQTVQIQNVGDQALNLTALSYPADFSEASGDANACTGSTSLSAGQQCDLPVEFTPENGGALSENVTVTDNALNVTGAQQSIGVTGTGIALPTLTSPAPGTVLAGPSVTFNWTIGTGVAKYQLWLGLNSAGSSDLFDSGWTTATSANVTNLPTFGATVYARLFSMFGNSSGTYYADYTYTQAASTKAALTSPTPGTVLAGPSATFTWTAGTWTTPYQLWLGLNGPGSSDLYVSGFTTATSATVSGLPTNGATVYARLFSKVGSATLYADSIYTEATGTPAALTTPTPGSTLGTSGVIFTWTPGAWVTKYTLWLGTNGPGSHDLFTSGWTTATSATVTKLPARGAMVYARLFSRIGSSTQYADYTYTEQ